MEDLLHTSYILKRKVDVWWSRRCPLYITWDIYKPNSYQMCVSGPRKRSQPSDRRCDLCGKEAEQDAERAQRRRCLARSRLQVSNTSFASITGSVKKKIYKYLYLSKYERFTNISSSTGFQVDLWRYCDALHLPGPRGGQHPGIQRREGERAACGVPVLAAGGMNITHALYFILNLFFYS